LGVAWSGDYAGQSNYFWLGLANYTHTNGQTFSGLSDTHDNYHNYTIDWQPDSLQWLIDGNVMRTVNKADTLSSDGSHYQYPSTPARVQLSIWPAGIPSSAPGTVSWAGGMINWSDPDYIAQGQFSTLVTSVSISCRTEDSTTSTKPIPPNAQSYIYTTNATDGVTPRVFVSNSSSLLNGAGGRMAEGVRGALVGVIGGAVVLAVVGLVI